MANFQTFMANHYRFGLALFAVILLLSSTTGMAYERCVLVEDYTNTYCGPCATWTPHVLRALEDFSLGEDYALIAPHVWWPGAADPWWQFNEECRGRPNYYGFNGVPAFFVDGSQLQLGNGLEAGTRNAINGRLDEESPLNMRISYRINEDEELLNTTVFVTSDEDLSDLTLFFVVGEQVVAYNAPNGQREHHGPTIDWIDDGGGQNFDIEADETLEFEFESEYSYTIGGRDVDYDENLYLCAWVADDREECLQANYNGFEINSAYFAFDGMSILDGDNGNGDGRAEAGETVDMVISIANDPDYLAAESTDIILSVEDDDIELINAVVELGAIENGQVGNNEEDPFSFAVAEDAEVHEVTLTFTITSQPGDLEQVLEHTIIIGWPDVLVVDATGNPDARDVMMSIFDTGEEDSFPFAENWDHVDNGSIPEGYAPHFSTIIWQTFNAEVDILTDEDQAELVTFLEGGGTLIMTGAYLASTLSLDGALFADYMKIGLDEENVRRGTQIMGVEGDTIFGDTELYLGGGVVGSPTRKSSLTTHDNGESILLYSNDDAPISAVKHEAGDYRTLFFAFPVECAAGRVGSETFEDFMSRVKIWLDNPPEGGDQSVEGDAVQPFEFNLEPAFPNPFNSLTTIPFSLDGADNVTLTLFDMNGREIAAIFEGSMTAGHHSTSFDASSFDLSSGVYYLQLSAGEKTTGQKLLYLR